MTDRLKERLLAAIEHGDDDHRAWLKEAIWAFFDDRPVPPSRGSGAKEARITQLEAEVERLTKAGQAVLDSWDANTFERERFVDGEYGQYWSPHAAMVNSEYIAGLRAALHQGDRKP